MIEKEASIELKREFCVLKIANKVAKIGKDVKWVFEKLDTDKNGVCK